MTLTMQTILRGALILIGLMLTLFGLAGMLVPRARFVDSTPKPGAVVSAVPSAVTINFSNKLAAESTMDVTPTIKLLPSGETEYLSGSSVVKTSGVDAKDASGKSMRANLRSNLDPGLYWVNWRTTASGWRTVAYGQFVFAVGMRIPEYITKEKDGTNWERAYQWRGGRAAFIGGLLMIALGLFLPKTVNAFPR